MPSGPVVTTEVTGCELVVEDPDELTPLSCDILGSGVELPSEWLFAPVGVTDGGGVLCGADVGGPILVGPRGGPI